MKKRETDEGPMIKDPKICFLGNYPPKECGIATFTKDLVNSMNKAFNPKLRSRVIAINEPNNHYNYNNKVILGINKEDPENYREMAKVVNNSPDHRLVCIQHEFGIFGGNYGENLLPFLEEIKKPVIVTFHSVLPDPSRARKKIVKQIASKASAIIVMAEAAVDILNKDYEIERSKIYVIHHGTPNAKFVPPDQYKKKLGIENKIVVLTFGLLSRGKGVEHLIKALPPLVEKYPNLLYLILGETHPNIRMEEGESYRNELINLVKKLGVEKNVKFENRYVTLKELVEYILACDIYAFTNLEEAQITSGTLAYATACGRSIVSTPITYAKEILAQNRGIVIKDFETPKYFTKAIDKLLSNPEMRNNMAEASYAFGRQMIWSNVARRHLKIFNRIVKLREETTKKYPQIKLEHLKKLTDKFGIIQFSKSSMPDKSSGYNVDDNARALITAILHNHLFNSRLSFNLAKKYLSFLEYAQEKDGRFKNNFKNENEILDAYSEDAFGRAIWALGYTLNKIKNKKMLKKTRELFDHSYKNINKLTSPRAKAFTIMGLYHVHKKFPHKKLINKVKKLANTLTKLYKENSTEKWCWFEDNLTYANAKLPEALFLAYDLTKSDKYLEIAEKSLHFLSDIMFKEDILMPIGQNGWCSKDGRRSFFDQQPIDASVMVHAYITAYKTTKDKHYNEKAVLAFNWFLGQNHLNQMLYDETTGGCFDGLGKHSLNINQGAESTISYLMARLMLEEIKKESQDI